MILSDKHNFLFLHCRKTGGSSIKCYLNKFLGENDIQIGSWHESIENGGSINKRLLLDMASPKTILSMKAWKLLVHWMIKEGNINKKIKNIQKIKYSHFENPSHPTIKELKNKTSININKYLVFCFVRNPYEMSVSDYIWRVESRNINISFSEFLLRIKFPSRNDPEGVVPKPKTNWPIYTLEDKPAVDFIGRHERFNESLYKLCDKIGIKHDISLLPNAKNKKGYNFKNYHNSKTKNLVREIYENELNYFGYSY
jgi:hypothetical protein